jgi:hypothetical protein
MAFQLGSIAQGAVTLIPKMNALNAPEHWSQQISMLVIVAGPQAGKAPAVVVNVIVTIRSVRRVPAL